MTAGDDRRPPSDDRGSRAGDGYETVIGLEIHVQLDTATKMFCGCRAVYGAAPNTHVCPVCLGLPGALPVPNARAVELAVRAALALGCTVHGTSVFARKNYFYPDLPKGYQITQYGEPLATGGRFDLNLNSNSDSELDSGSVRDPTVHSDSISNSNSSTTTTTTTKTADSVRIRRVPLEEDAGKLLHDRVPGRTAVDFNRAGVPLIEIVTEPDLRSPAAARAFLVRLKRVLEYLEVSDCDMETGSLRVDANVSVRPIEGRGEGHGGAGSDDDAPAGPDAASDARGVEPAALGTKTEVKNLNSFGNVERALRYEAERQARVLAAGDVVVHETRLWDADAGEARAMRGKEAEHDYRYFPEPDLPPLVLDPDRVAALRDALPELPADREARLVADYGLPGYDAEVLTADRAVADYFEALADAAGDAKAASNWVMGAVMAWRNETGQGIDAFPIAPDRLAGLVRLAGEGTVSSTAAQEVFDRMLTDDRAATEIVAAEGLAQVSDEGRLLEWVDAALAEHPDEAERLRAGEAKLLAFFVGAVMRVSGGQADPERVTAMLKDRVDGM